MQTMKSSCEKCNQQEATSEYFVPVITYTVKMQRPKANILKGLDLSNASK